jgi:deazaflavin-dependent oxidoreductase (nitroreductase family)
MNGNRFMIGLLRSPLHGMISGNTMLITYTGRRSGRRIDVPVSYAQDGDRLLVISSRDRVWWKNLRGGAEVSLLLRGRKVRAVAQVIEQGDEALASGFAAYLRALPMAARGLGVTLDRSGNLDARDAARLAQSRLIVEFRPGADPISKDSQ